MDALKKGGAFLYRSAKAELEKKAGTNICFIYMCVCVILV